jgi:2-polyprenyl-3-methyl-5-hydroxy-6-metoxy-1,4-benzoquinol methylase
MADTSTEERQKGPEEIERFLAREKLKYQRLEVGTAATPGHDRSYLNPIIFGGGFEGQTLLDIGSFLGYFCIEALRRGGRAATGIEPDEESCRQAAELARLAGVAPEYVNGDFETWDWGGRTFDTVICLNVLHHMYDAVHSLRRMMDLARRRVVLEFAAPRLGDVLSGMVNPLALAAAHSSAVVLGSPKRTVNAASRTFLFTPRSMRVLFNAHTAAFEPVAITRSPFKGRLILEANKRRIGHLAVIAGPTSSGKSTLMARLETDAALRARLGLEGDGWLADNAHLDRLPRGRIERLMLHYDILRPYGRSIRTFHRDPALDIMTVADRISVLTLVAPTATLRRQIEEGELAGSRFKLRKRQRDIRARYDSAEFLSNWYDQWFRFLERHEEKCGSHLVTADGEGRYELLPAARWREHLAEPGAGG